VSLRCQQPSPKTAIEVKAAISNAGMLSTAPQPHANVTRVNMTRWEDVLPAGERGPDFCPRRRSAGALFLKQAIEAVAFERQATCKAGLRHLGLRSGSRVKDGGKDVCPDSLEPGTCIVYSLGSRGDFSFEKDVVRQFNCSVYTFDCTMSAAAMHRRYPHGLPARVKFRPLCIGEPKRLVQGHGTAAPAGVGAGSFVSLAELQRQVCRGALALPSVTKQHWHSSDHAFASLPFFGSFDSVSVHHTTATARSLGTGRSTCSRWTSRAPNSMSSPRCRTAARQGKWRSRCTCTTHTAILVGLAAAQK
jgi:hypothetical protein